MIIKNINIQGHSLSNVFYSKLKSKISNELKKQNVVANLSLENKDIVFLVDSENKVLKSNVQNCIPLNKDDSRIKDKKRPYLYSHRLTLEQAHHVMNSINKVLDTYNLSADVSIDDLVLRSGKETCGHFTQKTYPVKLKE